MGVVLLACVSVHHVHAWGPQGPEEVTVFLELELQVVINCHVGARINPGPLEKQSVLLSNE